MPLATVLMLIQAVPSILAAGKSMADLVSEIASTHAAAKQEGRDPTEEEWQDMLRRARAT